MEEEIELLHWYNAYQSALQMMEIQLYTASDPDVLLLAEFEDKIYARLKGRASFDNITLEFTKALSPATGLDSELGLVIFADAKINKEFVNGMTNFALAKAGDNKIVNLILISQGGLASVDGKKLFLECAPTKVPRNQINPNIKRFWARHFALEEMQSNPLLHCLQPKIRIITDELEKETIRLELVKDLQGERRNQSLFQLLPRDPMNGQIPQWYGAYVGDVFEYTRRIGGYARYYRIVISAELGDD